MTGAGGAFRAHVKDTDAHRLNLAFLRQGFDLIGQRLRVLRAKAISIEPPVTPKRSAIHVRFGSKADIAVNSCGVRFTPKSGH